MNSSKHKFSIKDRDIEYSCSSRFRLKGNNKQIVQSTEISLVKKVTGISVGDTHNRFLKLKIPKMMIKNGTSNQGVETELNKLEKLAPQENPILKSLNKFNSNRVEVNKIGMKISSELLKKTANCLQKDLAKIQQEPAKLVITKETSTKPNSFKALRLFREGLSLSLMTKERARKQQNSLKDSIRSIDKSKNKSSIFAKLDQPQMSKLKFKSFQSIRKIHPLDKATSQPESMRQSIGEFNTTKNILANQSIGNTDSTTQETKTSPVEKNNLNVYELQSSTIGHVKPTSKDRKMYSVGGSNTISNETEIEPTMKSNSIQRDTNKHQIGKYNLSQNETKKIHSIGKLKLTLNEPKILPIADQNLYNLPITTDSNVEFRQPKNDQQFRPKTPIFDNFKSNQEFTVHDKKSFKFKNNLMFKTEANKTNKINKFTKINSINEINLCQLSSSIQKIFKKSKSNFNESEFQKKLGDVKKMPGNGVTPQNELQKNRLIIEGKLKTFSKYHN